MNELVQDELQLAHVLESAPVAERDGYGEVHLDVAVAGNLAALRRGVRVVSVLDAHDTCSAARSLQSGLRIHHVFLCLADHRAAHKVEHAVNGFQSEAIVLSPFLS